MTRTAARMLVIFLIAALILAMDRVYVGIMLPIYTSDAFYGFYYYPKSGEWTSLFWGLALLPAFWMPMSAERPSHLLYWALYLMVFIPTCVLGNYSPLEPEAILKMIGSMLIGVGIVGSMYRLPLVKLPSINLPPVVFWSFLFMLSTVCYYIVYQRFGTTLRIVSYEEIYSQRAIWFESEASIIVGYAMTFQSMVINPFLMGYGIYYKRFDILAAGILGQVFFFAIAAQKTMFMGPLLLLVIFILCKNSGRNLAIKVAIGSLIAFLIPLLISPFVFGQMRWWLDLIVHRCYINNGYITSLYFDFFSKFPHVFFADAKPFSFFMTSPYGISYKEALSWHFWNMKTDPNVNVMGDGFAQMGYLGVWIECGLLALAFWLLDAVHKQKIGTMLFTCLTVGFQVSNIANGPMPVTLFGGGFLLAVLLLHTVPRVKLMPEDRRDWKSRYVEPGVKMRRAASDAR